MMRCSSLRVQALRRLLFDAALGQPYALLDAARSRNLYQWLQACGLEQRSLYAGTAAITLAEQAPYLVRLEPGSESVSDLLEHGWGHALALFIDSSAGFEATRIALKKKLVAHDAGGRRLYFRFYDPRVARAFLASADRNGLRWWFDETMQRCIVEGADGHALVVHRGVVHGARDAVAKVALAPHDPAAAAAGAAS